jgi:ArsR family transcriptional regulator
MRTAGNAKRFKRLERLLCSDLRPPIDLETYTAELQTLTRQLTPKALIDAKTRLLKAVAHETRLKILRLLSQREMCVCELTVALNLTQSNASHHLNILENIRLIQDKKEGKWVFYSIAKPELVQNLFDFLEIPE